MILAVRDGNRKVETRAAEFGSSLPPPRGGAWSWSGERVSLEDAVGLPAVALAIRRIGWSVASTYLGVFEGELASRKERRDTWQGALLRSPSTSLSRFDWKSDIATSIEACGNACLEKVKARGKVVELRPLDMGYVRIRKDGDRKVFDVRQPGTMDTTTYGTERILHIRGLTIAGGCVGYSPIALHRHQLGAALSRDKFEGRFYANNIQPGKVVTFPHGVTPVQAEEWRDKFEAEHANSGNAGKTLVLGGGATFQTIPLSLEDAQFIESKRASIEDVARMFDVPLSLLHGALGPAHTPAPGSVEQDILRFHALSLTPRFQLIEDALEADADLFGVGASLYPQFQVSQFEGVDSRTRAEIEHFAIQDGTLLPDEVRAARGMGPLPPVPVDPSQTPGMVPQMTPVGGAPNPDPQQPAQLEPAANGNGSQNGRTLAVASPASAHDLRALPAGQSGPEMHLHLPENVEVEMRQPEIVVNVPAPNITVQVPVPVVEVQPADVVVNVAAAEVNVPPAEVTVNVPEPVVIIDEKPEPDKKVTFERGPDGKIKSAKVEES